MARVKRAVNAQKKKRAYFKSAKGYRGGRSKLWRTVKNAVDRARTYAYRDRKVKKREFRQLWIARINAAVREHGLSYSKFMHGLTLAGIDLDRKALAYLVVEDKDSFNAIIEAVKELNSREF